MSNATLNRTELASRLAFTLPDRLAKALTVSNVSSQEMADALGVSRNTISNYTNGRTEPRRLFMREWALRTGVPLEWLLTGHLEDEKTPTPQGEGRDVPPGRIELPTYSLQGKKSNVTYLPLAA